MDSDRRPRLTPAIADVRRAVREALLTLPRDARDARDGRDGGEGKSGSGAGGGGAVDARAASEPDAPLVLVALSGGPDSLALAAATAFEAPRAGLRAGAVIVDHNLQAGSADVAEQAAAHARALGLDPVLVRQVTVATSADGGGPEAAARTARYDALASAAERTGATAVLLGHTLDDQAETVLLGLARGSGAGSVRGMEARNGLYLRPLLRIRRASTVGFCAESGLEAWTDPQNSDPAFSRVRVRTVVLPMLEAELGPGIAEALARTAEQLREDDDALDHFAEEVAEELADIADGGISLPVRALASNPAALRQRLIRLAVQSEFHLSLSRAHTLEVARLVTHWHGQGPLDLPGIRVERQGGLLVFTANR
ncbi:tRNA(Ile)-lysidine synthase [Glaciihabitans tibetensis]|uniref:tRNA(Ile)-lysidine synthase n=1 Tax=Glaciihabitans tibetensis TaxID=1266600 RepID=A0A2T0VB52_9MICO|nr:tRNA lysidine(34) synthetase TilS [Glaciihabitans tibetensis]PRY67426.1 tRNA(Ile)-lysidine synthase [Glaciihabitans tibetensis]